MKKIGIMGGTFNPIHKGHIAIAQSAYEEYDLDQVLFLPSKNPPHKKGKDIASDEARMDMVRLAIEPYPFFSISMAEMEREGYSYTADTLQYYKKKWPDDTFYFIVGADSLHYIAQWKNPRAIFQLAHILSAPRYPMTQKEDFECRDALRRDFKGRIDFIHMEPVNISSREILKRKSLGKEYKFMLPDNVFEYILSCNLYADICAE